VSQYDPEAYRTPGQLIEALLIEKGWSQRVLAIVVGMEESGVNRMIADKRPIDAADALRLEAAFDVPASRFLDLQRDYDLAKARAAERPDPARAVRGSLFGDLPIAEMMKRGWIVADEIRNVRKIESELMRFFGVTSLGDIEILPHAAKKTEVFRPATPAQLAWLYRVKALANEMLVEQYSPRAVRDAITRLSPLLAAPEEARHVPRILAECGIRFVIVETLTAAKIDGVCFWLNDISPVIGLSMRYDRIDNFWFVLRHELEHVLRLHGQRSAVMMLDFELEGSRAGVGDDLPEEERVANEAAANFCVPKKNIDSFIARKAPFFAERDLLGFANTLNIHPGLVAGQLAHRTGRFERFRKHLVKMRNIVAPGAIVDGWGEIAPLDW
jgi:HTH-type transcriptional regulator/antitoxin HigA